MATHDEAMEALLREILQGMSDAADGAQAAITAALQRGDITAAVEAIGWDAVTEALGRITPGLQAAYTAAAMPGPVSTMLLFDLVDPRAAEWAARHAGVFIVDITSTAKESIRQFVVEALNGGRTVPQTARLIREVVPLSPRHQRTVRAAYESRLTDLLAQGVKQSRAEEMAARTSDFTARKLLNSRARTIARTEVSAAANVGRYAGWEEGVAAGVFPDAMLKEWVTGFEACPVCDPFDGTKVPWREEFGIGVLMPPAHPNCRCAAVPVWPSKDARVSDTTATRGELDAVQREAEVSAGKARAASSPASQSKRLPTTGGAAYLTQGEGDAIASASMRLSRGEITRAEYRAVVDPIREAARGRV